MKNLKLMKTVTVCAVFVLFQVSCTDQTDLTPEVSETEQRGAGDNGHIRPYN